jgi:hypothetical protein
MKAKHRHELHTNLLADQMGRLVQGMKTAPKSTSVLIWVFLILTIGTFAFWQYYSNATQSRRSENWAEYDKATHLPEDWLPTTDGGLRRLQALGTDEAGAIAGRAALFTLARARFQEGQQALTSFHRERGIDSLLLARDLYTRLVDQCPDEPLLTQEAMMGLAKVEESLIGVADRKVEGEYYGSLDKARTAYQRLADKYPESVLGKQAAEHVSELDDPEARARALAFYEELNQLAGPPRKPAAKSSSTDPAAKTPGIGKEPLPDLGPPLPTFPKLENPDPGPAIPTLPPLPPPATNPK